MYSDSEPVNSPLTMRDLPMVACSPVGTAAAAVPAPTVAGRVGLASKFVAGVEGRTGSGVEGLLPVWFGFHISIPCPSVLLQMGPAAVFTHAPPLRQHVFFPRYYSERACGFARIYNLFHSFRTFLNTPYIFPGNLNFLPSHLQFFPHTKSV